MSVKKAQAIANLLDDELGFSLVSYQNHDLELLKSKLEEFLLLGIETDELHDPDDIADESEEVWEPDVPSDEEE